MAALVRERGVSLIVVTHTVSAAAAYADEVVFFDRQDADLDNVRDNDRSNGSAGIADDAALVVYGSPEQVFMNRRFTRLFGYIDGQRDEREVR